MVSAAATSSKMYTRAEVSKHNKREELWIVIDNSVYDVTKYLQEHPGGEEIVLNQAGQDATEAFEDAEHSTDARQIMVQYKIGEIVQEERIILEKTKKKKRVCSHHSKDDFSGSWRSWLIPITLSITAIIIYRYVIRTR